MTGIQQSESLRPEPARIAREKRTIRAMLDIFCRGHHATKGQLCDGCQALCDYAFGRLDHCFFGVAKPTCAHCTVHCYKPAMREQVKAVMRYAGPRMLLRHPLLALRHWFDSYRKASPTRQPG
jgi:hypothetical protein